MQLTWALVWNGQAVPQVRLRVPQAVPQVLQVPPQLLPQVLQVPPQLAEQVVQVVPQVRPQVSPMPQRHSWPSVVQVQMTPGPVVSPPAVRPNTVPSPCSSEAGVVSNDSTCKSLKLSTSFFKIFLHDSI